MNNEIMKGNVVTRFIKSHPLQSVLIAILLIMYVGFHNKYRTVYVDDAWTLSWAYNWWTDGEVYDPVFGYVDGEGGTALFSRTFAFVYGVVGVLISWTRPLHYGLSVLFTLLSAYFWSQILKKLGYKDDLILWFVLLYLFLDIFFGMAHKIRVEALTMFLATAALLSYINNRPFFAAFLGMVAFENHPYGSIAFFWILAVFLSRKPDWWLAKGLRVAWIGKFIAGGLVGVGYYLWLHLPWLEGFSKLGERVGGNPLISYFFLQKYSWRHWPELVVIAGAIAIYLIGKYWKKDSFPGLFILSSLLLTILLPRGNYHYVAYIYPSLLLLILIVIQEKKWKYYLLSLLILFQGSQYGYLFWSQRDFNWNRYISSIEESVPNDGSMIIGPSEAWFPLHQQDFHYYGYFEWSGANIDDLPSEFYFISTPEYRSNVHSNDSDKLIADRYETEIIDSNIQYRENKEVFLLRYFIG